MKNILITGAAGGIGSEIATYASKQGYKVGLIDLDEANLDKVASNIPNSICLPTDITKEESIIVGLN